MEHPLILVFYINVGNMSYSDVSNFMEKFIKQIKSDIKEYITHYIIPIREGDTRLECLNPIRISDDDYQKIQEKLENTKKELDKILKESKNEN
jgi:5-bromo-4-chloroindolyl phosphate hydrolysis protein